MEVSTELYPEEPIYRSILGGLVTSQESGVWSNGDHAEATAHVKALDIWEGRWSFNSPSQRSAVNWYMIPYILISIADAFFLFFESALANCYLVIVQWLNNYIVILWWSVQILPGRLQLQPPLF